VILPGTRLHAGLFLAALAIVVFYIFIWKTPRGYEMRVIGLNPHAGQYAGINIKSNHLLAMFLAGAAAGMGGCVELMSVQGRLINMFAGEIGFDGVAVSLLGGNTPGGIAISALLFGMLSSGANKMQMLAKVPNASIFIMKGLIVLFVVGRELFRIERYYGFFSGKTRQIKAEAS
jgi:simple sugar transport system permease protein